MAVAALVSVACAPPAGDAPDESTAAVTPRTVIADESGQTLAIQAGQTLYLSGTAPTDPQAEIGAQTRAAMDRLGDTLGKAGLDHSHLVSCHVHLSDMDSYAGMNEVYGSYFEAGSYPARTTIEVPGLPDGAGVLLMCVAYAESSQIAVVRPPEDQIPAAMGPYSSAVRAGSTVYLSGQGGRNPTTRELPATAAGQSEQTLKTIGAILQAAGLDYGNAVLASSYHPPSSDAAVIDEAFESIFGPGGAPSRSRVALSRLPGDIAVEITFVAVDDRYVTRLFLHDQAPTATASPVSLSGGVAYTSATAGQGDTLRQQFESAVAAQSEALQLASLGLPNVVRVVAQLSAMDGLEELNQLVAETFPENPPALAAVQTRMPEGSLVALEMIAVQ